jgi:type I restriction enzyme M protein
VARARKVSGKPAKSLEATLWDAADKLRGNLEASEYKHVVLGLVFLKYVSDAFTARRLELESALAEPDSDDHIPSEARRERILESRDEYTSHNVFWVPPRARWEHLLDNAKQPGIGQYLDEAMDLIEYENPSLKGVLPKNFGRPDLDKRLLGELVDMIGTIGFTDVDHGTDDVLGKVYEYFLGKFAGQEGRGAGDDLAIYGQEFVGTTWKLARMNLAIRGIDADLGDRSDDSFHRDLHPDLRADFVIANPPFNKDDWFSEALADDPRWAYGTPPPGNANFAWVQHFVHHLSPTGTAGFVLANGSLSSKQSGEGKIRQRLVEADLVDCIVALPEKLFLNTGIPVCLWFLSKGRHGNGHRERRGEVLFIDARSLGRMETRTLRVLDDADVERIAGTYHSWRSRDPEVAYEDVPGFAKAASAEEVAEHDFVLTPGRYVGAAEVADDGEPIADKIARLQAELLAEFDEARLLEQVIRERLGAMR